MRRRSVDVRRRRRHAFARRTGQLPSRTRSPPCLGPAAAARASRTARRLPRRCAPQRGETSPLAGSRRGWARHRATCHARQTSTVPHLTQREQREHAGAPLFLLHDVARRRHRERRRRSRRSRSRGEEDVLGGVMPEAEGDVAEDEGKRKTPALTPSKGRGERGGGRAAA